MCQLSVARRWVEVNWVIKRPLAAGHPGVAAQLIHCAQFASVGLRRAFFKVATRHLFLIGASVLRGRNFAQAPF